MTSERRILDQGETWTIYDDPAGVVIVDPDWRKIKVSEKQAGILKSTADNLIVNAGTGFGKDWAGVEWVKKLAKKIRAERKRNGFVRGGPVVTAAICAPTEPNYLETWDKLKDQIPKVPGFASDGSPNYQVREGKRKHIMLFGNKGIRFEMVTLYSPDNVRGRGWDICLITEAAFMDPVTFRKVVLKRVNRGGYYGAIMLISTPKDNWFDEACEDARDKTGGPFSTYEYHHATSYDNPLLDARVLKKIKEQEMANPLEHDQERLAKLHIRVSEGKSELIFTPAMIENALTRDRIILNGPPMVAFDLMYGGDDLLARAVFNPNNFGLYRLDIWTADELKMDKKNPEASLVKLFIETNSQWPGCKIVYDKQGRYGGALEFLLPKYLNVIPMTRSREQKNAMVENFHARIATLGKNGKSWGIKIPDPASIMLDARHKKNIQLLIKQIVNYQKVYILDARGETKLDSEGNMQYRYTKGSGCGDDAMDVITWACSQLPPMGRVPVRFDTEAINRAIYLR